MNKFFALVFCFLVMSSFSVLADETASKAEEKKIVSGLLEEEGTSAQKTEESKTVSEAKDSRGVFSFMNFSFGEDKKKTETKKTDESLEQLLSEADAGKVDAQIMLGYIYLYGNAIVKADYEKSFKYYSMAAAQNDRVAINNLGILYYSGIGTQRDVAKAAEQFDKAAIMGNNEAAVNLAFIYLTGTGGVLKDYQTAMKLFTKASDGGNPTAKFMLGYAYYRGFIYDKNLIKAFALMKEAAASKYDDAQYILARMYLQGEGTTKNYGQAVRYLSLAAEQGNVNAMTDLGDILVAGTIYNKNLYRAHILFNVASVRGAPKAAQKRDLLETALKIEEFLQAQAEAEAYVEKPSEITLYIRKTFGDNIRGFIDQAIPTIGQQIRK